MPCRRSPLFYDCLAAEHKRSAFDGCVSELIALGRKGPMGKTGQIAGAQGLNGLRGRSRTLVQDAPGPQRTDNGRESAKTRATGLRGYLHVN